MESPIRSQSNFSFKSEENNLEKEMLQQSHVMSMQQEIEKEEEDSTTSTNDPQKNKEMEELHVEEATKDKFNNDDSYGKLYLRSIVNCTTPPIRKVENYGHFDWKPI